MAKADKKGKTVTSSICQHNQCSNPATYDCKYCHRKFCKSHSEPTITTTANEIWNMDRSDYEKYKKYNEDWQREDGHPCVAYTKDYNENRKEQKEKMRRDMNKAYDVLFASRNNQHTAPITASTSPKFINETNQLPLHSSKKPALKVILIIIILGIIAFSIYLAVGTNSNQSYAVTTTYLYLTNSTNTSTYNANINGTVSTINNVTYLSLQSLVNDPSAYLNKTVTTSGRLAQVNLLNQVPGSGFSLFDAQNGEIQVVFTSVSGVLQDTNYTLTGTVEIYHVPPAKWNGYTNNQSVFYINITDNKNSGAYPNINPNSPSWNTIFCINRMIFRTSNSRGLNYSQAQQLINYCGYYGYQPGIINGTNYTNICENVSACQTS